MTISASPLVLFWSGFNIHAFRGVRSSIAWTEYRFRHWLAFTLPSILGQDQADFLYWLICDPASKDRMEPLRPCLRDPRVRLVYLDDCPELLRQLPRRDRYLVTRIDSDDLYHPGVASNLASRTASAEFFQFNHGYACHVGTGEIRHWISRSSPFYAHVYGQELRALPTWSEPNHTTVGRKAKVLGPGHFLVTLHDQNTSSSIRLGGGSIAGQEARRVLRSFGLGRERDLRSLFLCARGPADWPAAARRFREELRPRYERYIRQVSSEVMAISLETAVFFRFLCELVAARRILDLGSGFSSVVARTYASAHRSVICHSVDTSPDWLAAAASHLRDVGLRDDGLLLWEELRVRSEPGYDLVLHDLGTMRVRAETLGDALKAVLPTGLILLDDYHRPDYAAVVARQLERFSADTYPEVLSLTRDRFGRCALLLGRVMGPLA